MWTRSPDDGAKSHLCEQPPDQAALRRLNGLADYLSTIGRNTSVARSLPLGVRIALAGGLQPQSCSSRSIRERKAVPELELVGGVARTLARHGHRRQAP